MVALFKSRPSRPATSELNHERQSQIIIGYTPEVTPNLSLQAPKHEGVLWKSVVHSESTGFFSKCYLSLCLVQVFNIFIFSLELLDCVSRTDMKSKFVRPCLNLCRPTTAQQTKFRLIRPNYVTRASLWLYKPIKRINVEATCPPYHQAIFSQYFFLIFFFHFPLHMEPYGRKISIS